LLAYHLQLHTRACAASQWLHVQCSSSAVDAILYLDVTVSYVCCIACANNLWSSMGGTVMYVHMWV